MTPVDRKIERINLWMIDTLRMLQWISLSMRGVPLSVKRN